MIYQLMAMYDKAVGAYMRPIYCQTIPVGIRLFEQEVTTPETLPFAKPEDFSLFVLGTWDDNTGETTTLEPECVRRGHEVPRPKAETELAKIRQMLRLHEQLLDQSLINPASAAPAPNGAPSQEI